VIELQDLIDRYYHVRYDQIWSREDMTDEQKLDADIKAWRKAADRIYRETGYRI
jgi:uncharacterized membrane protein